MNSPATGLSGDRPVLVMGAGTVGCYLGGCLQAAGVPVVFVGRRRTIDALRAGGLVLSDLDGRRVALAPGSLRLALEVPERLTPALVLLAVKSGATVDAAERLGAALPAGTPVASMQNGIGNADLGRTVAPQLVWLAGMVPFNVVETAPGRFHRGTTGGLAAADHPALRALQADFARAGLPLQRHADLRPVQWGKLLLNLNNPVNALSGQPLRAQLMERGYRRCLAALQAEALGVLRRAGIAPAKVAALPPAHLPALLRLPTPIFRRVASKMLRIDPAARSSMADDLSRGRPTEIDALCGEIVRLAATVGMRAPINARMTELVKAWPARPVPLGPEAMRQALGLRG